MIDNAGSTTPNDLRHGLLSWSFPRVNLNLSSKVFIVLKTLPNRPWASPLA
jgi:hypothetical protein